MVVRKLYIYDNLVHTLQKRGVIFTPFRGDDHSISIHSWGMTNNGVIFTPFRSNDHSKAIHSWGMTALWSDHHSIWWSDLLIWSGETNDRQVVKACTRWLHPADAAHSGRLNLVR